MKKLNNPETTKHVIVHNEEVYTYIVIEPQNCLCTGQPNMEVFDSEEEAKSAFPQAFVDTTNVEDLSSSDTDDLNLDNI